MDLKLKGKKVLISGGTHGIGRAIALALAEEGCSIAFFSRTEKRVLEMQEELKRFNIEIMPIVADALDPASKDRIFSEIKGRWGGVDILINNVGGGGRWGKEDILDTDEKVWSDVYDKNLTIALKLTKSFLPYMLSKNWGRIITITSIYAHQAGGKPWFNLAKVAQNTLMKSLSTNKKFASSNITFNSIAPGNIFIPETGWDEFRKSKPEEFLRFVNDNVPRGKMGTPEEVANVVAFLCSDKASLINGASIAVDGGESVSF